MNAKAISIHVPEKRSAPDGIFFIYLVVAVVVNQIASLRSTWIYYAFVSSQSPPTVVT
jgi:hypothetical protein